jgi:hypothetical protein
MMSSVCGGTDDNANHRNVVVEWLKLLFRIWEVPGSNLGPDTSYSDWDFSWFPSVPSEFRDSALN